MSESGTAVSRPAGSAGRIGLAIAGALIAAQALVLYLMGRTPFCTCGVIAFWAGEVQSPMNSQEVADWYSFSHAIHGFLFYAALRWLFPSMPFGARLALAVGVEAAWELTENSPFIIDRYRAGTISFDY